MNVGYYFAMNRGECRGSVNKCYFISINNYYRVVKEYIIFLLQFLNRAVLRSTEGRGMISLRPTRCALMKRRRAQLKIFGQARGKISSTYMFILIDHCIHYHH